MAAPLGLAQASKRKQRELDKERHGKHETQRHDASSFGIGCLGATSADLKAANNTAGLKVDTEAVVDFEVKFELEHLVPVKTALPLSRPPALRLFRRVWK